MNLLKEMKWKAIFYAVLYTIIGLILVIFPETTARTLAYAIAVSAIAVGALTAISYLFREVSRNYYRNDFVSGITAVIVGILILSKTDFVISIIPFILGVLVIFSGIMKLQHFIDVRRMGSGSGAGFFILALINIALGVLLVINPFGAVTLLFRMLGIGMIFSGVTDVIATLYMSGKISALVQEQEALTTEAKEL
ncbi:MAG: DUF308 domain-containing protein [Lachnospiraceae bacterium]|nr:DUF308 domain-containing protein [Lachnospiraceae bacterium]